ncbi:MAG: helix-turn-helix transcriptional regulator [Lewinellaceae bacterium]|nr:helix-turn-helix transcriptional regulator [Lewinellaceae bacterium]
MICEARIARFRQVVAGIGHEGNIEWRHLAFDCGYCDQAHFIRDFMLFPALTPEKCLQKKNGR